MFNKNKSKGQTSIEILAILGVLVIGGIILGTFYLSSINKKTADATEIANLGYENWIGDLNEPTYGSLCGNGIVDGAEDCDYNGLVFIDNKNSCVDWGFTGGTLSCNSNCTLDTSNCLGTFWIESSADSHGSIDPEGIEIYNANSTPSYEITADSGYEIDIITIDGSTGFSVTGPVYTYIFDPLDSDHTIYATFKLAGAPNIYTITSTAGPNCTINPLGNTSVYEGDDQSYVITPDIGYEIDTLLVDYFEIIPASTYTFFNVSSNHTIDVTCKIKDPTPPAEYTIFAFTRTEPDDGSIGGTIIPSGEIVVPAGEDQIFRWSANLGYLVGEVNVDGISQSFSYKGNSYTFEKVDRNHTIIVTFVKDVGVNYTLTYTAGPNCTINGTSPQTVPKGGSGTPVSVIADSGYTFSQWSDSSIENPRTDTNVQGNITVTASCMLTPPEPMKIDVSPTPPTMGSATINTDFNVDVNTLENAPAVRYTLKVDFAKFNGDWFSTSNCSYNGVYAPSITLGTNLVPQFKPYTFSCNTIGTYRLGFTATNDSNAANYASKDSTWTINNAGTVATPTASLNSGAYYNDQLVTLSCNTSGAIIHYTLDGTDANCSSTQYVGAIPITGNKTLKAIGCLSPMNPSGIMTKTYTLKVATPVANPVSGTYILPLDVSLSSITTGAEIRYTTDGSTPLQVPAPGAPIYSGAITLTSDTQVKAIGYKEGYSPSSQMTETYIKDLCGILSVDAYTLNWSGETPISCGALSPSSPMDIRHLTCTNNLSTLNTITYESVWVGSNPSYNDYMLLQALESTGNLFCQQHGLGSFVAAPYEENIEFALRNFVCSNGNQFTVSNHGLQNRYLSIVCANGIPKTATPVLQVNGNYGTLTTTTLGATICYTMNSTIADPVIMSGGVLMCADTQANSGDVITLPSPFTTFKAKAIMLSSVQGGPENLYISSDWVQSDLLDLFPGPLTVMTPVASPGAGTYIGPQVVSLSSPTSGAAIHYTTNGSTPTCSSTVYSGAFDVNTSKTVKAIGCKTGMNPSAILSSYYNILPYCNNINVDIYNLINEAEPGHPPLYVCSDEYFSGQLASTSCVANNALSTLTYSGVTLNGVKLKWEASALDKVGIQFCEDHNLTFYSQTHSSSNGSATGVHDCYSPLGNKWNEDEVTSTKYYTSITCQFP